MCTTHEDGALREIINALGNAERNKAEIGTSTTEVTLQLSAKFHILQGKSLSFMIFQALEINASS